jgi:hypothetical protein
MMGMLTKNYNKSGSNYSNQGYFFYCANGYTYSKGTNVYFTSGGYSNGTVYDFEYNKQQKEIVLYRNGSKLGVPFKNVDTSEKLYPAFEFYDNNSTIEIINKDNGGSTGGGCLIN